MSNFWKSSLVFVALMCFMAFPAKSTSTLTSNENIIFSCIEDQPLAYFCTNILVTNPAITLHLSKLERKKIYGYVDALRVMPTITNFTKKIIISAKVRLTFLDSTKAQKDFIINQRIINGAQSNANASYLIRSDVPSQLSFYTVLDDTIRRSLYDNIVLELIEVKYNN